MRVLVFGDSIAQGFWDTHGGWVGRLRQYYDERQLKDLKKNDEPVVFNLGISGGNSRTILGRFDNEVKARKIDGGLVIVICTGVNDSCIEPSGRYATAQDDYESSLNQLAKKAKSFTNKVVFVGLVAGDDSKTQPVFWNKNVSYTNDRIKQYEQIMSKVATANGSTFVQIHDHFKKELDAGKDLLADGLHPNDAGHELMFKIIQPCLDKLIKA